MDDDHPADISRPRRRGDRITSLWDRPMRRPLCAGAHGAIPAEEAVPFPVADHYLLPIQRIRDGAINAVAAVPAALIQTK